MRAAYDAIAEWYAASVSATESLAQRVAQHVIEMAGDVAGQDVCDLACGQGLVARQLARRGARAMGIDLSAKLLEIARREEAVQPLGIEYRRGDAQTLDDIPPAAFDGVACSLALMDIPDLAAVFRSVRRVLRPAGWFVFSITHPCFQIPPPSAGELSPQRAGADYFTERFWRSDYPHGVRGKVGAYHRTLSTYLNRLAEAYFILERVLEPDAVGETSGRTPAEPGVPKFLVVKSSADGAPSADCSSQASVMRPVLKSIVSS